MSVIQKGVSAIGRLAVVAVLAAAFLFGMAGVVYMSLQGSEVSVPEITGKDFTDSEKELAMLGLKIKKRADRFSPEKPNTVIEQLPKPGETVKTGQMILVVTSKGAGDSDERPPSLKNATDADDTEKIEEMISDKPKKSKSNSNASRKKADTARDVTDNTNSNSNSNSSDSNSNKREPGAAANTSTEKPKSNSQVQPAKTPNPGPPRSGPDGRNKPAPRP